MDILIRELDKSEYPLLRGFLYDAIFLPLGASAPPPSIVDMPELKLYIENFGHGCDHALAAEVNGDVVGAIWARVMDDYGHIDDDTPSLAMSVKKEYRNMGVGSRLLDRMLSDLRERASSAYRCPSKRKIMPLECTQKQSLKFLKNPIANT